jgi:hypothetical protein
MSGLTYVGPEEGRGEDLDHRGLQRIQEQHSLHHMPHTQRGDRGEALVAYRIAPWDGLNGLDTRQPRSQQQSEGREALSWLGIPCRMRALHVCVFVYVCVCVLDVLGVLCVVSVCVCFLCVVVWPYGECPYGGDEEAAGDPMVQRPRRSLGQHTAVLVVLAA